MSEVAKQHKDTSSAEFTEGVEAGRNTTKDAKNWKVEDKTTGPLFMRGTTEGNRGNAQDEKDETEE